MGHQAELQTLVIAQADKNELTPSQTNPEIPSLRGRQVGKPGGSSGVDFMQLCSFGHPQDSSGAEAMQIYTDVYKHVPSCKVFLIQLRAEFTV